MTTPRPSAAILLNISPLFAAMTNLDLRSLLGAILVVPRPMICIVQVAVCQAVMVPKRIRCVRRSVAFQICRTCSNNNMGIEQATGHQRGVKQKTDTNGNVYVVLDEVYPAIAQVKIELHFGVHLAEFLDSLKERGSATRRRPCNSPCS